jgi:hypothetical protein
MQDNKTQDNKTENQTVPDQLTTRLPVSFAAIATASSDISKEITLSA